MTELMEDPLSGESDQAVLCSPHQEPCEIYCIPCQVSSLSFTAMSDPTFDNNIPKRRKRLASTVVTLLFIFCSSRRPSATSASSTSTALMKSKSKEGPRKSSFQSLSGSCPPIPENRQNR